MNDFTRTGNKDTYVEVSADWMSGDLTPLVYYFADCIGKEAKNNKEFKLALIDIFEITEDDLK